MTVGEVGLIILAVLAGLVIFLVLFVTAYVVGQTIVIRRTATILADWAKLNPLEVPRFRELLVEYFDGYTGIAALEKQVRKRLGTETKADKEASR